MMPRNNTIFKQLELQAAVDARTISENNTLNLVERVAVLETLVKDLSGAFDSLQGYISKVDEQLEKVEALVLSRS